MAFYFDSMRDVRVNGAAKLTLVTLLFVVSSLLLSCGKEGVALQDEGALSRVGEVVEARGGVRLFYGRPLEGVRVGALAPAWGEKHEANARVDELSGIHRVVLGESFGERDGVWFSVVTRYEWAWVLPPGVRDIALEPGQPLMLQGYAPMRWGIGWRMERTAKETRLFATAYSISLRYSLSGVRSGRTIPENVERIRVLDVYCQ